MGSFTSCRVSFVPEPTVEVLACPHCDRLFRTTPSVLGKKIRCRGCRKVFHVPKDTSSVPVGPVLVAAAGAHDQQAPPLALECVVNGCDARRCPDCGRTFTMKPAFAGKVIRCRGCKTFFRVAATENPAAATVAAGTASDQAAWQHPLGRAVEPAPPPVPPEPPAPPIFEDIGDVLDELVPGETVASVVRPRLIQGLPQSSARPVAMLSAILLGGFLALPATQLILWRVFHKDPLGIARLLPESLRWLAP